MLLLQIEITPVQAGLIFGAILGFVLGLIPLVLGIIKKRTKFGCFGFNRCNNRQHHFGTSFVSSDNRHLHLFNFEETARRSRFRAGNFQSRLNWFSNHQ